MENKTHGEPQTLKNEFQVIHSALEGCFEIIPPTYHDERGRLVKIFNSSTFDKFGIESNFVESFYTVSGSRVLRGMHFQLPPSDHAKLVYCISGAVMDVGVDLRKNSPTFGNYASFEINNKLSNAVYLPRGVAHGFYVREAPAIVVYAVTSHYDPERDSGISWNSFGMTWPDINPVISKRDAQLIPFNSFKSPFS
jgi:dTDP-4-dehydrorhamnose 3,5-epimerase